MLSSHSYEKWLGQQINSGLKDLESLQAQLSLALNLREQFPSLLIAQVESILVTLSITLDELEETKRILLASS